MFSASLGNGICILIWGTGWIPSQRANITESACVHRPLARCEKIAGAHAPGMPGTFSPPSGTSDPDMHHGTCVTHVPWCMPGSLTSVFLWSQWRGKTFPAFPAHAQPAILRIWQEAHALTRNDSNTLSIDCENTMIQYILHLDKR